MKTNLLILPLALFLCSPVLAAEPADGPAADIDFDGCKDNVAVDAFLRKASPLYAAMARIVELDGAYKFKDKTDLEAGKWNAVERTIETHTRLKGAKRVSVVAFEMTNAFQQRLHTEVDMAAAGGSIITESEFALRHELVEYDGLRLHREMLKEIESALGKLPPGFFYFSNPKPKSVAEYQLPLVTDYVKQMKASGHTAYYYQWFHKQKQTAKTQPGKDAHPK